MSRRRKQKKIDWTGTKPLLVAGFVTLIGYVAIGLYMESVSPGGWL